MPTSGDAQTGGHEPPPGAALQRQVVLGAVQDGAPVPVVGVWPMPMNASVVCGEHREDHGRDEARGDDGGQVRHDLREDDAPRALAVGARRLDEVPLVAATASGHAGRARPRPSRSPRSPAATVTPPAEGSWPAMMMMSGSCGMTRKTLASTSESPSSPSRRCSPAVTPTSTPMTVATMPAIRPTIIDAAGADEICDKMSWPSWLVPSQCSALGGCSRSALSRARVVRRDPRADDRQDHEESRG